MDIPTLCRYLDDAAAAAAWLGGLGVVDTQRAHDNLLRLARWRIPLDLLAEVATQLEEHLGQCPDPDMALNHLERYVAATRSPLVLGTLLVRDPAALPTLLQIFSNSHYLSEVLISDPESFDLLRITQGQPLARQSLIEDLVAEVDALEHDTLVLRALRRFKHRQTLRISYGDILRQHSLPMVTRQISFVADAVLAAALRAAGRRLDQRFGTPRRDDGAAARFVVLGMGKLGGTELNYSSDIDLIFLYDADGKTDGARQVTNTEFFEQLAREIVRLLTDTSQRGAAYRVDLRLRPEGRHGPMAMSVPAALQYYDLRGRTWERQAYIKARPVAGDLELGIEFLEELQPWIYRRYLSQADIGGIRALKRRLERRAHEEGADSRDVKSGHGGIRDVEFVIQFLQLLNGGDLPELRTSNTLEAIAQLENVGCLSNLERSLLAENYRFLRKIEHRLQIMLDLQTHLLPEKPEEMRKLALRMGYRDEAQRTALAAFEEDYRDRTALNRRILDHLLHDAFRDDTETEAEVDLVLDPDPPEQRIREVLGRYRFREVMLAYRNLMALAEEDIRFLSTRRCRHFLAAIAPQLLRAIAATPDPDSTLVNLDQVSASLGGKGVLWELFSFNPPSLHLYVELCAYSSYLCGILTSNPGMSDGLMDSLVLDRLPSRELLEKLLMKLCRSAEDITPILQSFKNDLELRVGVRDLLGKEDVQTTTGALSDIAEICLVQIAAHQLAAMQQKLGRPTMGEASPGRAARDPCEMVILALGKFGGREMNYQSDTDIVFLYEAEGQTVHPAPSAGEGTTSNQDFFSRVAQRIIQTASRASAHGRLYEVDARLRPTGRSGPLAVSLDEFLRYYMEGRGQIWERQALCKARVVFGTSRAAQAAARAVAQAAFEHPRRPSDAQMIRQMRARLEETATPGDLKRGAGGIVDIEFITQMLQLRHARGNPSLQQTNTLLALDALNKAGHLEEEDFRFLSSSYRLLRTIESRLQLVNPTARDTLPEDPTELAKLAHLVRYPSGEALLAECAELTQAIRRRFERIFHKAGA